MQRGRTRVIRGQGSAERCRGSSVLLRPHLRSFRSLFPFAAPTGFLPGCPGEQRSSPRVRQAWPKIRVLCALAFDSVSAGRSGWEGYQRPLSHVLSRPTDCGTTSDTAAGCTAVSVDVGVTSTGPWPLLLVSNMRKATRRSYTRPPRSAASRSAAAVRACSTSSAPRKRSTSLVRVSTCSVPARSLW